MRAIVTVVGKDKVGIIAKVSSELAKIKVNVEDISQTILQDYFVMIMMVDISASDYDITEIAKKMAQEGKAYGVEIRVQHEDIFNAMHKI